MGAFPAGHNTLVLVAVCLQKIAGKKIGLRKYLGSARHHEPSNHNFKGVNEPLHVKASMKGHGSSLKILQTKAKSNVHIFTDTTDNNPPVPVHELPAIKNLNSCAEDLPTISIEPSPVR